MAVALLLGLPPSFVHYSPLTLHRSLSHISGPRRMTTMNNWEEAFHQTYWRMPVMLVAYKPLPMMYATSLPTMMLLMDA